MNINIATFRSAGMVDFQPAVYALDRKTGIKYFGIIDFANNYKIQWTHVKFLDDESCFENQKLDAISQNVDVNREATEMIQEIYGIKDAPIRGATSGLMFIDQCAFDRDDARGEAFFNDL